MIRWLSRFLVERKYKRKIERKSIFRLEISPNEELPLLVWTYFVKYRAGFRCEECDRAIDLQSHHIIRLEDGGKNILRNGKCLCPACHATYRVDNRSLEESRYRRLQKWINVFGEAKGHEIHEQCRTLKTSKEMEEFWDKIVKETPPHIIARYFT